MFGQTTTVTINQNTKKTQPPIGTLTMEGATNFFITRGTGSPEGVVTASPGSLYMDITGFLYVKASGVGDTGWQTATLGSLAWGSITGTLANQTDLQNALNAKVTSPVTEADISLSDVTTNDVSASKHGFQPKLPDDPTLFMNGQGDYVQVLGGGNTGSRLISGGGVAWTGIGLSFIVSSATYLINGVQFSSAQTPLTLSNADPNFDRIDVFAVDNTGSALVVEGQPGGPPVAPQVDPATQLELTHVLVAAGATTPTITNVDIYLENTEWTTSTNSAGTINLASTNNPYAGTKDIEGTNVATGNLFTAVKPSGTLKPSDYNTLVFQIRNKQKWAAAKAISIFWLNGSTTVGTGATLKNGAYGFDFTNTTSYQQIAIPTSVFNTGTNSVDSLRFQVTGGGANMLGWYIDNIVLQTGSGGGTGGGDFSTNTTTSVANEIVLFADTTGKLGKRSTGTGTAVLTNGVLSVVATPTPTATATATPTPTATATATPTPTPTGTGLALEDSNGNFQSLVTTSAGVASAITDETGTAGSLVFSTSPALSGTPSASNLAITGTAGAGYLTMIAQSANPSAPAAGTLLLHSATTQGFTRMEQDNEGATNLVYGRDNVFIAKNTTAGTITKGQVVYNTTTSTGAVPNIGLAKADSVTTLPALGVALDDIAANAFGQIMVMGVVDHFNTNSFATGDELYVSPTTAGAIQASIPTGVGQFSQRVGSVLNKGVGDGSMLMDIAPFVAPVPILMKSVTFVVDGAGIVLGTGTKNPAKIPFGGTLQGWALMAKPSGSVTLDVYRAANGAGLPTVSIIGTGTKPALSSAVENSSTSFTNWTSTTLAAGDNLAINVDSATTVTYVALTLYYK